MLLEMLFHVIGMSTKFKRRASDDTHSSFVAAIHQQDYAVKQRAHVANPRKAIRLDSPMHQFNRRRGIGAYGWPGQLGIFDLLEMFSGSPQHTNGLAVIIWCCSHTNLFVPISSDVSPSNSLRSSFG